MENYYILTNGFFFSSLSCFFSSFVPPFSLTSTISSTSCSVFLQLLAALSLASYIHIFLSYFIFFFSGCFFVVAGCCVFFSVPFEETAIFSLCRLYTFCWEVSSSFSRLMCSALCSERSFSSLPPCVRFDVYNCLTLGALLAALSETQLLLFSPFFSISLLCGVFSALRRRWHVVDDDGEKHRAA